MAQRRRGRKNEQGFGVYSTEPSPGGFVHRDMTGAVARSVKILDVRDDYSGAATIAGCTVLYGRDRPPRAVALVDTPEGARARTTSEDPAWVARIEGEECVGRAVRVEHDRLSP